MSYVFMSSFCFVCSGFMTFNPKNVPSYKNNPICEPCIKGMNKVREQKGMLLWPVAEDAYTCCHES